MSEGDEGIKRERRRKCVTKRTDVREEMEGVGEERKRKKERESERERTRR